MTTKAARVTKKRRFPNPRLYTVLYNSIQAGCTYASRHAWKYDKRQPSEEEYQRVADVFMTEILSQLAEDFDLDQS